MLNIRLGQTVRVMPESNPNSYTGRIARLSPTMTPQNRMLMIAGIEKILVVKDGKAVEKPITTRRRTTEWTEVVRGVTVGEAVVLEPGNLQSGQAVTVVE